MPVDNNVKYYLFQQNEDGTINTEEANKLMEKVKDNDAELYEKLNTVYQTCNKPSIMVEDHCLTAVNLASCAVAEAKKVCDNYYCTFL